MSNNVPVADSETVTADGLEPEEVALTALVKSGLKDEKERQIHLSTLGYKRKRNNKSALKYMSELHVCLAKTIYNSKSTVTTDDEVLDILLMEAKSTETHHKNHKLKYLLAETDTPKNILDVLLDPDTYSVDDDDASSTQSEPIADDAHSFEFQKLEPFICFLLRLQPKLLKDHDSDIPLVWTIVSPRTHCSKATKADMIRFLCDKHPDFVKSFGRVVAGFSHKKEDSKEQGERDTNALHLAIEQEIDIHEDVLQRVSEETDTADGPTKGRSLLFRKTGDTKKSCLHMALTAPFTTVKSKWAITLAKLQPDLLMEVWKSGKSDETIVTPLQHFEVQRSLVLSREKTKQPESKQLDGKQLKNKQPAPPPDTRSDILTGDKLDALADQLKYLCLSNINKDAQDLKSMMFRNPDSIQISLRLKESQIVSEEFLKGTGYYVFHSTLKFVYIPRVTIDLKKGQSKNMTAVLGWKCVGQKNLFMIFDWLKAHDGGGVKRVLDVIVDDMENPHSDDVIFACLDKLQVETWNWKRPDISSELIFRAAGATVKVVHLYCSGLESVLRSWSAPDGLPKLAQLKEVHVHTRQGLESKDTTEAYLSRFKTEFEKNFKAVNPGKECIAYPKPVQVKRHTLADESVSSISNSMSENDRRFEEQDWMKVMKEFADFLRPLGEPADYKTHPIRVALIDDGVTPDLNLNKFIEKGRSWSTKDPPYNENYNSSYFEHGTNMARLIQLVCPFARLYVAKLDPPAAARSGPVTFTIDSAAEAIEWAVKEKVDIISMSWSIDQKSDGHRGIEALKRALRKAVDGVDGKGKILLFCANPDAGNDVKENKTYPSFESRDIFCIGATSTKDGKPWEKISAEDDSCAFYLPGVELTIPGASESVESSDARSTDLPPSWHSNNGSSLSCALAAGLSAMILYSARVQGVSVNEERWAWLKKAEGMRSAMKSIAPDNSKWIPVRKVFGDKDISSARMPEEREKALKYIVDNKYFVGWKESRS